MNIELKNYKPHRGLSHETVAFTATIYIDGTRAASVENDGNGGPNLYHFADRELEQRFYTHCKGLPPLPPPEVNPYDLGPLPMDADLFISDLIDREEHRQWLARQKRGKVLFRLTSCKAGEYLTVKLRGKTKAEQEANRKAAEAFIYDKYRDQVVEIC